MQASVILVAPRAPDPLVRALVIVAAAGDLHLVELGLVLPVLVVYGGPHAALDVRVRGPHGRGEAHVQEVRLAALVLRPLHVPALLPDGAAAPVVANNVGLPGVAGLRGVAAVLVLPPGRRHLDDPLLADFKRPV